MNDEKLEPRVKSLEDNFRGFMSEQREFNATLIKKVDSLTKPNYMVLLTVISVAAIFWYQERDAQVKPIEKDISHLYELHEASEHRVLSAQDKLDEKLQREFQLALEATKEGISSVVSLSRERDNELQAQIDKLESWRREQILADLQELRERRMKDHP